MTHFKDLITEVKLSKKRFKSELVWNIDMGKTPSIVGPEVMKMIRTDEFLDFMWDDFQSKSRSVSLKDFEVYVDGLVDAMQNHKGGLAGMDNIKKLIGESINERADLDPAEVEKVVASINKNFGKTDKLVRKDDPVWHDTNDLEDIFLTVSKPPRGWLMKLVSALEKAGMKEVILDKDYNELEYKNSNFSLSASKEGKSIKMVIQRLLS